jgi:hypothetical protein
MLLWCQNIALIRPSDRFSAHRKVEYPNRAFWLLELQMLRLIAILTVAAVTSVIAAPSAIALDLGHCFQGGCDVVWELNKRFDQGVRSKSESMVGPVKEAFIEVMNLLFDQKLKPMIDQIDQAAGARLSQFDKTIKDAETGIDTIITDAGRVAVDSVGQSAGIIKTKIIDATFARADSLVQQIYASLQALVEDLDCKIDGQTSKLQERGKSLISYPQPWNGCYRAQGFTFSTPTSDDYIKIYRIRQCELLNDLEASSTVRNLKDNYARLLLHARRFVCIMQLPEAKQLINSDVKVYVRSFVMWQLMSQ